MYNAAGLDQLITKLLNQVKTKKQDADQLVTVIASIAASIEKIPDYTLVLSLITKLEGINRIIYDTSNRDVIYSDQERRVITQQLAYSKQLICGSNGGAVTFTAGKQLFKYKETIYNEWDDIKRLSASERFFKEESWVAINDTVFTVAKYLEFLNSADSRSRIESGTGTLYWRFLCNPEAARAAKQVFKLRHALQIAYRLGWYDEDYATYCKYILRCLVACGKFSDANNIPLGDAENILVNYIPTAQNSAELTDLFDNNSAEPEDIRVELRNIYDAIMDQKSRSNRNDGE